MPPQRTSRTELRAARAGVFIDHDAGFVDSSLRPQNPASIPQTSVVLFVRIPIIIGEWGGEYSRQCRAHEPTLRCTVPETMELRQPTRFVTTEPLGKNQQPEGSFQRFYGLEPFVDADVAAEFLSSKRKTVLDWARSGSIPAHPFGRGKRTEWRFRLSEIASHAKPIQGTISTGSPEMVTPEKRYD